MASDENVNSDSCIYDPNFAIVCSFFEKFSSICGIKHPAFSDLQQMLDSTDEISPELIDLHVRLMRKAKKNVNPDRWQRTLAKFCYFHSPQESWDLEQNGYKKLNFNQKLKLLLCVCEAQFDLNVKFKNDINKLPIDELRLKPIGKDKDGIMYWIHTDEKLKLKVYKENTEDETFELLASDRDGLAALLEKLRKERDPDRKYDEELSEEEEEEDLKVEPHEKEDVEDETDEEEEEEEDDDEEDDEEEEEEEKPPKIRPETTKEQVTDGITTKPESQLEKTPEAVNLPKSEKNDTKPLLVEIPKTKVIEPVKLNIHEQKPPMPVPHKHVDIKTKRFDKAAEIALKKEKVVVNNPVNMKPGEFAQHLEKLHSEKILLPLLTSPLPEITPFKADCIESLKTKINMKFSMIKPVLQNEVLKSKIEDVKKNKDLYMKNVKKELPGKPGLKLEQILKSKLGQKLAANNPVQTTEELMPNEPVDQSSKTDKQENFQKDCAEQIKTLQNELAVTNEKTGEPIKRKISSENDGEPKKLKIGDADEKEIEEPVMLITGVGSGKECESYPEEEEELEFVLYVSGVGSGVECETGNDETEEDKEKHAPLSHNIKDMLPKNEDEPAAGTSNGDKKEELEKKKPKLWTIDAICNSDSKDSKKEDISCFPNYNFNKDKKPDVPYRNEFSFFNTPMESKESDVKDHVIPSFYFGCDTQNPPYATDARNINSFKSKSHNVKDIMEGEDGKDKNDVNYDGSFKRYEENVNHDSAFNLCTRESPPKKNLEEKSHKVENVYSDVVNLSTSNSVNTTTNENQNESKISNESGAIENDLSEITEKTLEIEKKEHSSKSRTNEATEISHEQTENSKQNINDVRKLVDASEITKIMEDSVENEQISNIPSSTIDKVQVVSKSSKKNEEFKCDPVLDTHLQSTEKSLKPAEEEKPEIFNVNEPNSIKGENSKQVDIEPKSIEIKEKSLNLELKFETEKSIPDVFEKQESVEIDKPKVLEVNDETESDENKSESACINVIQPVNNDVTQSLHEESKSSVEEPQPTVNESQFVIEESQSFVRQSQSTAEESQPVAEESQPDIEETLSVVEEPQPVAEKPQLSFEESKTPSKDNQKVTSSEASELQNTIQTDKINVNLISKEVESKSELPDKSPIEEVFQESSKLLSEIQENETESKINADDDSDHVPDIPSDTESCENQKIEKTVVNVEVAHKKPGRTGRPKKSKEPGEGSSSESKPKRGKSKENEETPVLRTSTRLAKSASIKKEETTSKKERKKKSIKDAKESKPGKKYDDESEVKKLRKTADEESDSKTSEDDAKLPSKMSDDFEISEKPSEDESEIKPLEEKTDVEMSKETSEECDVREAEKPLNPEETESKVEVKVEADETTAADESQPIAEPPKKVGKPRGRKKKRGKPPGRTPKPKPEKIEGGEENETQSIKLNIKKVVKKGDEEQDDKPKEDSVEESKESETAEKSTPTKKRLKRGWLNEIDVNNITPAAGSGVAIRQSRRIAQLKIKEQAEGKYIDQITPTKKAGKGDLKAKQGSAKKGGKSLNKKSSKSRLLREDSDGDDSNYEKTTRKKRKKKDPKKKFKPGTPWKATSDTSTEEEDDDHFDEDDEDEELAVNDVSDHEFSPESDLEDEDFQPVKRARTAHSKPKTEDKPRDDLCCQKCKTAEQPEWILLCDKCDEGWHAACLRPPLMVIPEGDWFCPPCQHNMLICNIHKFLKTYDKNVKKRNNEELRKKRLEYVGISFSNILSEHQKSDKNDSKAKEDEEEFVKYDLSEDNTEDESEEEPLYQLRIRRQANVSYRLSEYDELMNSAIQRENGENGENPEAAVVDEAKSEAVEVPKVEKEEDVKHDVEEKEKEELSDEQDKEEEKVSPMILQLRGIRKKAARLTQLEVSSEDDRYSDEDFKGSSGEDYDEDEYAKSETDSDEARYKKSSRGPVRRSTRARVTRYDNDFINDDESEEDDYEPKKKKKRFRNSESDSEEEDSTWGKRKRSKVSRPFRSTGKKRRRRIVFDGDTDEDKKERKEKKKKSRVTYGLEESEDDYPQRKTRGKKINYLENLGTDSEEESASSKSKNKKILSDDDDYINEDERNDVGMNANGDKNESVVDEDGVKKFQSSSGSKAEKSSPSNLHELIAANNTGVIRTYSKSNLERNQKSELGSDTSNFDQNESSERRKRKSSNDVQIYSGIVKGDNKLVLKKVDTNPSLEGMHSMAQSLPQMLSSPSKYSISMIQKMVPGDNQYPGLPPGQPNYAEMGINYEDTEGISPNAEHPIRTPSPSKLYSGEGPPPPPSMGRPPPFVVGPGMPPGMPPNIMRGPPPMPHLRGPPPTALPPMSQPPITTTNVAVPNQNPIMESPNESPKRRARGRGKKQLEIERMKRESLNRGEEMIPLHLLKPLPSDINPARPSFGSSTHEFGNYPNMPRLPYSTASGPPPPQSAVTVSVGNSKRVKITPTRMRMPTPQNVMRFPRPSMIHNSPMPLDPSPSGGTVIAVTDKTATNAVSPAPPAVPGKEAGKKDVPEQYYPTPYPPASQAPRGFPPRPEFPFVRKPLPPMYQQPIPTSGTPPPRPQIVTTNSVISGPIPARTSPSPSKAESPTPQYSTPYPPGVPPPNVSSTSKPSTPTSQPVSAPVPSTTSYQPLHIKQLPAVPSSGPTASFNSPYYAAPPVPNSYPLPQPSLPPVSSNFPPPVSTLNQPFPVAARIPSQASFVKSPQPAGTESPATTTTSDYSPGTQPESSFQFQECNNTPVPAEGEGQFQQNYEEESAPTEEQPSGEFGGLVSYFSSQREDDLDA